MMTVMSGIRRPALSGTAVQTRILYADTDRSAVVYHANYLRYFEFGRASLMRDAAYPYKEIEESGYVYPIIDLGIQFYEPLYYDDPMWIHTRPAELERVKLRFDYVITHAETGESSAGDLQSTAP